MRLLLLSLHLLLGTVVRASPWVWTCDGTDNTCLRVLPEETLTPLDLMACKMTCSDDGVLWPLPSVSHTLDKSLSVFADASNFRLGSLQTTPAVSQLLRSFFDDVFFFYISSMRPEDAAETRKKGAKTTRQADVIEIVIDVTVTEDYSTLVLTTDESYTLDLQAPIGGLQTATVTAATFYGARHALETLSQLVSWNRLTRHYQIHRTASIVDAPSYAHRGISIDTSRNFFPTDLLKRLVDGMAHNKLNVLHWHFSDSQSFPVRLPSVPQLAEYGAYSDSMVYEPEDVLELVEHARVRGIKVVPELDAPAHAANGWQFGEIEGLGPLALCVNNRAPECRGGVCGILNPTNPGLYTVLRSIYSDLLSLFSTTDTVHMGGDEVKFDCWRQSQEVSDWMASHGLEGDDEDMFGLWEQFQVNASAELTAATVAAGKGEMTRMLWTSSLTLRPESTEEALPLDEYLIQVWSFSNDSSLVDVVDRGYRVVVSCQDALYLDCGLGNWAGKAKNYCGSFKQWRDMYDFDPRGAYLALGGDPARLGQVVGAEAALWSEYVGPWALEGRVWPRAAAVAERLWTNVDGETEGSWKRAETRMLHQRERMVERGLGADVVAMRWCHLYEGSCRCANDDCSP